MQINNKKQLKVIFIPGNGGGDINAPDGWFPYLKQELEKMGLYLSEPHQILLKTF
jgi:hypothetical protein